MGIQTNDSLSVLELPDIGSAAGVIVEQAERLGAAVVVYDDADRIVWANAGQRLIMPCSDYSQETYAGLFWAALRAGQVGNPAARQHPQEWLTLATLARASEEWLQKLNHYAHGAMALTHRRIDRQWSLQIRFPVQPLDLSKPGDLLVTSCAAAREIEALHGALDQVDVGVAIVDLAGQCLYANAFLRDIVFRDVGLGIVNGRLRPARGVDRRWWRQAIQLADAGPSSRLVQDRSGVPALVVSINPGRSYGTAVVLVAPVRRNISIGAISSMIDLLGVSRPVAEVLAMMAVGHSVDEIADDRGSTPGYIYQQVAKAKKAVSNRGMPFVASSQAQLAAMVMQVAATTGAGRAQQPEG